eukprot:CAMPEP_0179628182 /NCGR_PEP_ID=MMETSP0932-20121108/4718_1 /TAXON_ID=548131 ORGANISM="Ostreococcus mediterraneus, Strain clade-D-RCC2596" /NCGR_SAMPLE_ID=MMETSP0932 /ASSEMBLY_ACC=CAM_ASM_000582 /LENGTH=167 /DNA_ID=CAMNT_0021497539 /DNA_START=54 /DNA_END=557 /DNA_ORIENTATION=+
MSRSCPVPSPRNPIYQISVSPSSLKLRGKYNVTLAVLCHKAASVLYSNTPSSSRASSHVCVGVFLDAFNASMSLRFIKARISLGARPFAPPNTMIPLSFTSVVNGMRITISLSSSLTKACQVRSCLVSHGRITALAWVSSTTLYAVTAGTSTKACKDAFPHVDASQS